MDVTPILSSAMPFTLRAAAALDLVRPETERTATVLERASSGHAINSYGSSTRQFSRER